jgi:glycosyltransferase involved in cell wall biosynthesis
LKVLHVSTSDHHGGAARAAYRLHAALRGMGADSHMLVQHRLSDDPTVSGPASSLAKAYALVRPRLDRLFLGPRQWHGAAYVSPGLWPGSIAGSIRRLRPDVVHLHWVAGGFVSSASLGRVGLPVVWTFHDMWPMTGGCHYAGECTRYRERCGACPLLTAASLEDVTRRVLRTKERSWGAVDIHVVAPSRWMAACARSSTLFRRRPASVIPNAIDLERFSPVPRDLARRLLALPADVKLIAFGAVKSTEDRRKGFHLLAPALERLKTMLPGQAVELLVFGAAPSQNPPPIPLRTHFAGRFQDDISLAVVYNAADVFVAPSLQDNLPNTVLEALACGVPCVAFDTGGLADMIEHGRNGYLAKAFDPEDLGAGIAWVLAADGRREELAGQARARVVERHSAARIAAAHIDLYQQVLARRKGSTGTHPSTSNIMG